MLSILFNKKEQQSSIKKNFESICLVLSLCGNYQKCIYYTKGSIKFKILNTGVLKGPNYAQKLLKDYRKKNGWIGGVYDV